MLGPPAHVIACHRLVLSELVARRCNVCRKKMLNYSGRLKASKMVVNNLLFFYTCYRPYSLCSLLLRFHTLQKVELFRNGTELRTRIWYDSHTDNGQLIGEMYNVNGMATFLTLLYYLLLFFTEGARQDAEQWSHCTHSWLPPLIWFAKHSCIFSRRQYCDTTCTILLSSLFGVFTPAM